MVLSSFQAFGGSYVAAGEIGHVNGLGCAAAAVQLQGSRGRSDSEVCKETTFREVRKSVQQSTQTPPILSYLLFLTPLYVIISVLKPSFPKTYTLQ